MSRVVFEVSAPLWQACQSLLRQGSTSAPHGQCDVVADHDGGLVAQVKLESVQSRPVFLVRINYRTASGVIHRPPLRC